MVGHHNDAHHQSPLRRLTKLLQPELFDIGVVTLFSLIVGILSLATPITVEALVNTVAFGRYLQPLFVLALLLFTFLSFAAFLRCLQAYVAEVMQRRIFVRVVAYLAERLPRARGSAFAGQNGAEMLNRFFEVITVQKSAAVLVLDGIAIVITGIIGMIVLALYHPYLLGFNIVLIGTVLFAVFALGRGAVQTAIDESYKKYAVASWLEQLALYPTTFKLGGGLHNALQTADDLTVAYLEARAAHFRVLFRQIAFTLAAQACAAAGMIGIGGFLVINGQLTLGQLVAAELIVAVVVGSFAKLGKHMESYYDLLAACDKLGYLFELPIEEETGHAPPRTSQGAHLRFHQVHWPLGYEQPAGSHAPRRALTFEIRPGERILITGPSASGKSSLLDTLYALYSTTAGYIEFDGIDLRSICPAKLREQVVLLRDPEILAGTIAENVHLGRPNVTHSDVRRSLEAVGLWQEIMNLPEGLDSNVAFGGGGLSGSQRIRLMLARALAGHPRLLLIDALLDQLSETHLRQALTAMGASDQPCTVLLISNRERLADFCDRELSLPPRDPAPGSALPYLRDSDLPDSSAELVSLH
ncbi:peptidase domain-containing ABC transporter [Anatilimnocola floriformis]|uniref:peptidase domain-containing ABC transporter n=1 Tax=Anatilimnocola floriformis TaxID=2948575 RepID=UPI0020C44910|nr:ATP-binding cassette domain-containing protein [Anatilimnocola floriformis]